MCWLGYMPSCLHLATTQLRHGNTNITPQTLSCHAYIWALLFSPSRDRCLLDIRGALLSALLSCNWHTLPDYSPSSHLQLDQAASDGPSMRISVP
jgi:hypothetical protein